ncbi:MAG: prenyltransferase [Chloroflexota bacterium]
MDSLVIRFFVRISRPAYLLSGVLVYALGAGIARYLGHPLDWSIYTLGQFWVVALQLGAHYLAAYFLSPVDPKNPERLPLPGKIDKPSDGLRREIILWPAFAALAAATSITIMLIRSGSTNGVIIFMMGITALGACLYSIPPLRLATSGYGELTISIVMANLIPALAFSLQAGELHRLLAMTTFPLTMLHLAMLLAFQLPAYLEDVRHQRQTLMVRLGWKRGMNLHNLLILGAFTLIGLAMLFGLPSTVALPVFFVLPLGLFQIWYMTRIAAGAKPNWRALNLIAALLFALTAYLFTFEYWVH